MPLHVFEQQRRTAGSVLAFARALPACLRSAMPIFDTRSVISVISSSGDTSSRIRFSSPFFSRVLIQSRRSSYAKVECSPVIEFSSRYYGFDGWQDRTCLCTVPVWQVSALSIWTFASVERPYAILAASGSIISEGVRHASLLHKVKCNPYFKLRSRTPHSSRLGSAELAAPPAPGTCPRSVRCLQLADRPWPATASSPSSNWAAAGCSPTWIRTSKPSTSPSRRSPTSRSTAPRTAPTRASALRTIPITKWRSISRWRAPRSLPPPARPATIRMYWSQDIASAVQKAAQDGCDVCSISWGADEADLGHDGGRSRWNRRPPTPPQPAWSSSRHPATTTRATAAPLRPMSTCPRRARTSSAAEEPTRPRPRRPCGTTTPARPTAKARAAATRPSFRRRSLQINAPPPPTGTHVRHRAAWFRTSPATPIPIPATTSSSTEREPSSAEPARSRRSMPDCSPRSEPSSDSSRRRSGRIRQTFNDITVRRQRHVQGGEGTRSVHRPGIADRLELVDSCFSEPQSCAGRSPSFRQPSWRKDGRLPFTVAAGDLDQGLIRHKGLDGIQGIAEALPFVEAAAQRAHALDAQLVQGHGRFGGRGLAGTGAVKHHVAIARNLVDAGGEGFGRHVHRSRQSKWIGHQFQGMAQVDDVDLLAGIELALQFVGLEARLHQLAQQHAPAIEAANERSPGSPRTSKAPEKRPTQLNRLGSRLSASPKSRPAASSAPIQRVAPMLSNTRKVKYAHPVLAGDGRGQGGQAGNELGIRAA